MRILHFFLGFNRSGGLNRYAADLAFAQKEAGDQVFVLFPGGSIIPRKTATITRKKDYDGISCYELLGGKPIPLLEGIRDPQMILNKKHCLSQDDLNSFCNEVKPDIIHIHTWMGFPQELLSCLHERGCRIVFTTHDYFGICPKVNFIKPNGDLCCNPCNEECSNCNASAPSELYLQLRNLGFLFRIRKYLYPVLKKAKRSSSSSVALSPKKQKRILDYQSLMGFYQNLTRMCDVIHFNSETTKKTYLRYLPNLNGIVLPITHRLVTDRRRIKKVSPSEIQLCFVGSLAHYKGFPILRTVLKELKEKGIKNWKLNVWGSSCASGADSDIPEIKYCGNYNIMEERQVFLDTDLLIVPSVCFETFGFIALEALSFGVPVLCSDTVGAQCLVSSNMIYHGENGLKLRLSKILNDPVVLEQERERICSSETNVLTMDEHVNEIKKLYLSRGEKC